VNFDGGGSDVVRAFFVHNALYWLEEYRLDGLRLDAVHAIHDETEPDILEELAAAVRAGPGRERHVHLVLENDCNTARYLRRDARCRPVTFTAQWNDDAHHALHVLLTGEDDGYYRDYADRPAWYLGRCLAEGFGYQGEPSRHRDGESRGEPSAHLPPEAFVTFLQNHDQTGNRAFGERLASLVEPDALRAAVAVVLLAPSVPLLFMGEEYGSRSPFQYFCDFSGDLAQAVRQGRRREFARFQRFSDPGSRAGIPDPCAPETFRRSKLDWDRLLDPVHGEWLDFYRELLHVRHGEIVPRLAHLRPGSGTFRLIGETGLQVSWGFDDGSQLVLLANLGSAPQPTTGSALPEGTPLFETPFELMNQFAGHRLPPWSAGWYFVAAPR
jgi:malto-oligosyltrehalose trehalohydrolase